MRSVWRQRLVGVLLVLGLALGTTLAVARQRMPTPQDMAAAEFLALGGTLGDLCGGTAAKGVAAALEHFCAGPGLSMLDAPQGVWAAAVPGAARTVPVGRAPHPVMLPRAGGPGARAPPRLA